MSAILIVEDNKELAGIIAVQIKAAKSGALSDHEILIAHDYIHAMDILGAHDDISVVILDIMLPKHSGLDLIEPIRETHPMTSIVVMTAFSSEDRAIHALNLGAHYYLRKPVSIHTLRAVVSRGIERYATRRALAHSERRFHSLFRAIPVGIMLCHTEGGCARISDINPHGLSILNLQEDVRGLCALDVARRFAGSDVEDAINRALLDSEVVPMPPTNDEQHGGSWYESVVCRLSNSDVALIYWDISRYMSLVQELSAVNENLTRALELMAHYVDIQTSLAEQG